MTDIEFVLLLFGLIIVTLVAIILVCIVLFRHKKKCIKSLNETEFNKKLSNNKKMFDAESKLNEKQPKNN